MSDQADDREDLKVIEAQIRELEDAASLAGRAPPSLPAAAGTLTTNGHDVLFLSLYHSLLSLAPLSSPSPPPTLSSVLLLRTFLTANATDLSLFPALASLSSTTLSNLVTSLVTRTLRPPAVKTLLALNFPHDPQSHSLLPTLLEPAGPLGLLLAAQFSSRCPLDPAVPDRLHVVDALAAPVVTRLLHHFPGVPSPVDADGGEEGEGDGEDGGGGLTDRVDRPEWFFGFLKELLVGPLAVIDEHVQPLLTKYSSPSSSSSSSPPPPPLDARFYFLSTFVSLSRRRLLLLLPSILSSSLLLSKTLTAALDFERHLDDEYLYKHLLDDHKDAADRPTPTRIIDVFASNPARLTSWMKLELTSFKSHLSSALSSPTAWTSPSPSTNYPAPFPEMFSSLHLSLSSRILPLTLSPARSKLIQVVALPLSMSFYDALYDRAKESDVRDVYRKAGGEEELERVLWRWCGAIEGAGHAEAVIERDAAGHRPGDRAELLKIAGTFGDLGRALVGDLAEAVSELGRERAVQYLVRSHMLLEEEGGARERRAGLAGLAEMEGGGGIEQQKERDRRDHHRRMVDRINHQRSPSPSPDLVPCLHFYSSAIAAVRSHTRSETSDRIEKVLADQLLRPFVDRIRDAPRIASGGRVQFAVDMDLLLALFSGRVLSAAGNEAGKLREFSRVLGMDDRERRNLHEAAVGLTGTDRGGVVGLDEGSLRELDSMLEAKGFVVDGERGLSKQELVDVMGKCAGGDGKGKRAVIDVD